MARTDMGGKDMFLSAEAIGLLVFYFLRLAAAASVIIGLLPAVCMSYNEYRDTLPDALEIEVENGSVTAFRADAEPRRIDLPLGEEIRYVWSEGLTGGVVTSDRIAAISAEHLEWKSMPLELGEKSADSSVSVNIALFVTMERSIVFDSTLNGFSVYDLPVGENVTARTAIPDLTVFSTMNRAVGYAAGSGEFEELDYAAGEMFRGLQVSLGLITVTTSDRNLLFQAPSGEWVERERPLDERGI